MLKSALLGLPPATNEDKLVYKFLAQSSPRLLKVNPSPPGLPHQDRARGMITGTSFAIAFAIIITCTRIWVRIHRKHAFGADDAVIIPAALGCVAYLSLNIATEAASCLGKHVYDCTYQEFRWFRELAYCNSPIFYFTVFTIKISITLGNRRITGISSKRWQIAHWTYLSVLFCLMPLTVLLNVFVCSPIPTHYNILAIARVKDPHSIKCIDENALGLSTRALHIITDWFLLPVPITIIWRLQMPLTRKIRLILIFCVGFISSVASIMRNVLIERLGGDLTYDYYTIYAWDVIDIFFATVVASLPALNGLVDQGLSNLREWGSNSSLLAFTKSRFWTTTKGSFRPTSTPLSSNDPKDGFQITGALSRGRSSASSGYSEQMANHASDIELQSSAR